ncbi:hypothetical protein HHE06_03290 [Helicobacter heilmannii]|nr:hypothetical protein HHE06_03290 [Helicobacter heilmannii]
MDSVVVAMCLKTYKSGAEDRELGLNTPPTRKETKWFCELNNKLTKEHR